MLKNLLISATLLATTPVFAGERFENETFSLPPTNENPAMVHIICMDLDSTYKLLDNLPYMIQIYMTTGQPPENCAVFYPIPIALGEHKLDHLYLTDSGELVGVILIPLEDGEAWTYINERLMVKGKEGTF